MARNPNMKVKGVAFNLTDEDQLKLFQHCDRKSNFSSYIKRLVHLDMASQGQNTAPDAVPQEVIRKPKPKTTKQQEPQIIDDSSYVNDGDVNSLI